MDASFCAGGRSRSRGGLLGGSCGSVVPLGCRSLGAAHRAREHRKEDARDHEWGVGHRGAARSCASSARSQKAVRHITSTHGNTCSTHESVVVLVLAICYNVFPLFLTTHPILGYSSPPPPHAYAHYERAASKRPRPPQRPDSQGSPQSAAPDSDRPSGEKRRDPLHDQSGARPAPDP